MPIPCYLAMTGGEFFRADRLPEKMAWMACHYSCYGTGLSNLPSELPEGSLVIVNDRTPPCGHDAGLIAGQLLQLYEELKPFGFLLDFQRADFSENREVAQAVTNALPCPVGVSDLFAKELTGPVFLPPPPLDMPLQKYTSSWAGRKIWLEVALQTEIFTLTEEGCSVIPGVDTPLPEPTFAEASLFCRYHWEISGKEAIFTLQRAKEEIDTLLQHAEGIDLAVGLYQQLDMANE